MVTNETQEQGGANKSTNKGGTSKPQKTGGGERNAQAGSRDGEMDRRGDGETHKGQGMRIHKGGTEKRTSHADEGCYVTHVT